MTQMEVLDEIKRMPLTKQREIVEQLTKNLRETEKTEMSAEELERREDEFERYLLEKGTINQIPPRTMTDEEFDEFEPIEFEGEPLSEQIIRERI